MNFKAMIAGAIAGFTSAVVVDIRAWQNWPPGTPFDWGKAVQHWIAGAVTGFLTGAGIGAAV